MRITEEEIVSWDKIIVDKEKYLFLHGIVEEEGTYNAFLIDVVKRGSTPLKDILTGVNTTSLIDGIVTNDSREAQAWRTKIRKKYGR